MSTPKAIPIEQFNNLVQTVAELKKQFKAFDEYMSQDTTPPRKEQGSVSEDSAWVGW
jgi:hypothetical protein